jgi:hypothetical protein
VEWAEEPNPKIAAEELKTLSSLQEVELLKVQKIASITLKRRRVASVLDVVIESVKVSTPTSAPAAEGEIVKGSTEVSTAQAAVEVGPSTPDEVIPSGPAKESAKERPSDAAKVPLPLEKEKATEGSEFPALEASTEELEFMVCHAAGKKLTEEQIAEARQYAKDLKYPLGSFVYSGTDEDDFLYCLSDNKEIYVCREMTKNMGFMKLELGLSAMSKDELADSLAYNSLKVYILLLIK